MKLSHKSFDLKLGPILARFLPKKNIVESKDCKVTAEDYKCAHCSGNHCTRSKECEIRKSKEKALAQNYQYGQ